MSTTLLLIILILVILFRDYIIAALTVISVIVGGSIWFILNLIADLAVWLFYK